MKKLTDLQKLKKCYDELGIKYHEVDEDGVVCIQKMSAHDKPGFLNVMGYGFAPLKKHGQLTNFIEFTREGKIASW